MGIKAFRWEIGEGQKWPWCNTSFGFTAEPQILWLWVSLQLAAFGSCSSRSVKAWWKGMNAERAEGNRTSKTGFS